MGKKNLMRRAPAILILAALAVIFSGAPGIAEVRSGAAENKIGSERQLPVEKATPGDLDTAKANIDEKEAVHTPSIAVTALKVAIVNVGIFAILLLTYLFFISEKRMIKRIKIRERILAGFMSQTLSLSMAALAGAVMLPKIEGNRAILTIVLVAVPLALSVIFIFIYVNAIMSSFKKVVAILKQRERAI